MDLRAHVESLALQAGQSPFAVYGLAAALGVTSHVGFFIHGHHVPYALQILEFYSASAVFLLSVNVWLHGWTGVMDALRLAAVYLAALFASMSVYRVFFHPLRHFPGPLAAKLSKLYGPYLNRNGKMHLEHDKLHAKYGDFVRTGRVLPLQFMQSFCQADCLKLTNFAGPDELFIFTVDGHSKVNGSQSKCTKKDTVYEAVKCRGESNLDSILSREEHRPRRLIWDKAMSSKGA